MRTANEARKDNMKIDKLVYPWQAYIGDRFEPDQIEPVLTDLESDLLDAMRMLEKTGVLTEYLGDDPPAAKAKKQARTMITKAEAHGS